MTETAVKEQVEVAQPAPAPQLPAVQQDKAPRKPRSVTPRAYPASIAKAIIQIQGEIGRIQKEGFNEFQRYKYTRWEDINEKLSPLLAEHGLIIVQSEQNRSLLEENDKGSVLAIVYHFTIINEHGDQWPDIEWTAISRLRDQKGVTDDKAAAKCHTQAEKQFCIKQFKIRTDDFVDSDAHSTLPKKNAKDVYTKLQADINATTTVSALNAYWKANKDRIEVLPADWQTILLDLATAHKSALQSAFDAMLAEPEFVDDETGEIQSASDAVTAAPAHPSHSRVEAGAAELTSDDIARIDKELGVAAEGGMRILETQWKLVPSAAKPTLKAALDRRHKPRAYQVDQQNEYGR